MTAALKQMAVPHRAVIVGDGPDRSAVAHELPHAIFTGALHGEALATAYASSDIFVFPATAKASAMSPWKRWRRVFPRSAPTPLAAAPLVVPGETGFLAPPGDAEAFTRHVTALVQDEASRRAHGRSGPPARLEFSWERPWRGCWAIIARCWPDSDM